MHDTACNTACASECRSATCPAYRAMRETAEAIRRREVERHADHLEAPAAVDALTRRIVQRVLDVPRTHLPAAAQQGDGDGSPPCPGRVLGRLFTPPGDAQARCERDE